MRALSPGDRDAPSPRRLLVLAVGASLGLAIMPLVGIVTYPFRLLMTIVHELSHGLAALLTGGRFVSFVVFPNGSGLAYTAGGWDLVIIPAGYLGTAIFGASLLALGRSARRARLTLAVVGVAIVLLTLLYATPTIFSARALSGLLTVAAGVGLGAAGIGLAWRAGPTWILFALYLLAVQAGLTAFGDLVTLIGLSAMLQAPPVSDAQAMARITGIPAIVWAVLWAVMAVAILGWAVRRAWANRATPTRPR